MSYTKKRESDINKLYEFLVLDTKEEYVVKLENLEYLDMKYITVADERYWCIYSDDYSYTEYNMVKGHWKQTKTGKWDIVKENRKNKLIKS